MRVRRYYLDLEYSLVETKLSLPMSLEADGLEAQVVSRGAPDREKDLIEEMDHVYQQCNQLMSSETDLNSLHTNIPY